MQLLNNFIQNLLSNGASEATVKNYASDIAAFIRWYELGTKLKFHPDAISIQNITSYKNYRLSAYSTSRLSAQSLDRHLSSLRKFTQFLLTQNIIPFDPFAMESERRNARSEDPNHLIDFRNYLYSCNINDLTIKNYIIDIQQFLHWAEIVTRPQNSFEIKSSHVFKRITPTLLAEYRKRLIADSYFSSSSINRKLSSLRKFMAWAIDQEHIPTQKDFDWLGVTSGIIPVETTLPDSKPQIAAKAPSKTYSKFPPLRLLQKIGTGISLLLDLTIIALLALITTKIIALLWTSSGKDAFLVSTKAAKDAFLVSSPSKSVNSASLLSQIRTHLPNLKKEFYDPLSLSFAGLPLHKKIYIHLRHTRPKWYHKYHSYPIVHHFHFAVLILIVSLFSYAFYQQVFADSSIKKPQAQTATAAFKVLRFAGKLTDKNQNPIFGKHKLRFGLYTSPTASGSAQLWQEVRNVQTSLDGTFSVNLGSSQSNNSIPASECVNSFEVNTPCGLPQTVFANGSLWLGISIDNNDELGPRQQIPTTDYSLNSRTVNGLFTSNDEAIIARQATNLGNKNQILALDSSGVLQIGGTATTTFSTTLGSLQITGGKSLLLNTSLGSNGNIVISPDGTGIIDARSPFANLSTSSNLRDANGNLTGSGNFEIDDIVGILATSSGQAAFTVNQTGLGPVIAASVSGKPVFGVDNNGDMSISGQVNILGSSLTFGNQSIATIQTNANQNLSLLSGTGAITLGTYITGGDVQFFSKDNAITSKGDLLLSGTISQSGTNPNTFTGLIQANNGLTLASSKKLTLTDIGGSNALLFAAPLSNIVSSLTTSSSGLCLLSGSTIPSWGSCPGSSSSPWSNDNTNIYPANSSYGLLIGSNLPSNATFAVQPGLNAKVSINGQLSITQTGSNDLLTASDALQTKFVVKNNGQVGIGTSSPRATLDIVSNSPATSSALIENTSNLSSISGLAVKLDSTSLNSSSHFLNFLSSQGNIIGSIAANASGNGIGFTSSGIADMAEYLPKDPTEVIPWGTIICQGSDELSHPCSNKTTSIIGVASQNPSFVGGINQGIHSVSVGISGQVLTRVSIENGEIAPGDPLTISEIQPGVAVKAVKAGPIIGKALEKYQNNIESKILVLVEPTWFDPVVKLAQTGNLSIINSLQIDNKIASSSAFSILNKISGTTLSNTNAFSNALIASLKAGSIESETITTNDIKVKGQSLSDYIQEVYKNTLQTTTLTTSIAAISTIRTNLILPNQNNQQVQLALSNDEILIQNSRNGKTVASINSSGDATFSGTLRAKRIIADEIVGLNNSSSTNSANYITNITNIYNSTPSAKQNTDSPSTLATTVASASANNQTNNLTTSYIDLSTNRSITGSASNFGLNTQAQQQGLIAFGPSSLSDVSVARQLLVDKNMILADSSINVLGRDLEIQPLKQGGVSFESGLVYIDPIGNMRVSGNADFAKDVTVHGTLAANQFSPLGDGNLQFKLVEDKNMQVQTASGTNVFQVDQTGNIQASGSGNFAKILANSLQIVRSAQADTSITQTQASSSAGKATILQGQTQRTIVSPFVKATSLIYITPTSDTHGQAPYIARQTAEDLTNHTKGSFTIQISTPQLKDIGINWWIVN